MFDLKLPHTWFQEEMVFAKTCLFRYHIFHDTRLTQILWSHLLKMQRIVLLSSLLWWELGTNSLITGPGEWLLLRHFTSKLSWSWDKSQIFHELWITNLSLSFKALWNRLKNTTSSKGSSYKFNIYLGQGHINITIYTIDEAFFSCITIIHVFLCIDIIGLTSSGNHLWDFFFSRKFQGLLQSQCKT